MNAKNANDLTKKYYQNIDMESIYLKIKDRASHGYYTLGFDRYDLSQLQISKLRENGYNVEPTYNGSDYALEGYIVSW